MKEVKTMAIETEVFGGVMLGDGCVNTKSGTCWFAMSQHGHKDWLLHIIKHLELLGVVFSDIYPKLFNEQWYIASRTSSFLSEQRRRWYPGGKKIVPSNITLTSAVLANWFMGDGSSVYRSDTRFRRVRVVFAAYGFLDSDRDALVSKLSDVGLRASNSSRCVRISEIVSVNSFMSMVEPEIVDSFRYKIKNNA